MRMQQTIVALGTMGALFAAMPVSGQNQNPSASVSGDASMNRSDTTRSAQQSLALRRLQQATLDLEKAIDAMYRQPAVSERNRAIGEAHQAISEVSIAMRALPSELRTYRITDSTGESAEMQRLRAAAQQLRESVQAMAQYPSGDARNRAIDQANQALFDVQQSMIAVSSYRLDQSAGTQGAGSESHASASTAANRSNATTGSRSGNAGTGSGPSQQNDNLQRGTSGTAASSGTDATSSSSSSSNSGAPASVFGVVVMPALVAGNENLGNGCWARLYENPEYGGNSLTLVGPVDVNDLGPTGASDWNGVDSIITGPKASVSIYQQENFADRAITIEAGQRVQRLRQREGVPYLGRLESVRVACTGTTARG